MTLEYEKQTMCHQSRDLAPSISIFDSKVRSVLKDILVSLHVSRRLGAKRVIGEYRHLLAKDCASLNFRTRTMRNLDRGVADNPRARRAAPPLKAWTMAVLVGFGILHVVGERTLHQAPSIRPIEPATAAIQGD
ncbi:MULTISPECIES: hypothetical protein [unclassified Bradyrhizobium]|uniref:hypothetical protein n=1 Tax=unclassified Bradyrhizobium TaxID=2631580 RepID=UPI000B84C833|nr:MULTISPECIES: hypothetical protein [unclassified Bradyrhizobium]MBB4262983.1 hypothetical protein [Bradyrhizobium sp. CIR3A]MBB4377200.1 hypothetical protein [Bradyrhizobium sp. SBR1B]NYG47239.1 hypothetical protein [Bradyrhizobium sp. IAR9]